MLTKYQTYVGSPPSLLRVAQEPPLSLEEPPEVLRPRGRVVSEEQLQDEGADDGRGVDAMAGEGADPLRADAPLVVLWQLLGHHEREEALQYLAVDAALRPVLGEDESLQDVKEERAQGLLERLVLLHLVLVSPGFDEFMDVICF